MLLITMCTCTTILHCECSAIIMNVLLYTYFSSWTKIPQQTQNINAVFNNSRHLHACIKQGRKYYNKKHWTRNGHLNDLCSLAVAS